MILPNKKELTKNVPSSFSSLGKKNANIVLVILTIFSTDFCQSLHTGRHVSLSPRLVRTRYGELRGVLINLSSRGLGDAEAFLGIPYAAPPIGNQRFMPPGSPSSWRSTKIADKLGAVCPQKLPDIQNETEALGRMSRIRFMQLKKIIPYLKNQSEDCLHLNIYTPAAGKVFGKKNHFCKLLECILGLNF